MPLDAVPCQRFLKALHQQQALEVVEAPDASLSAPVQETPDELRVWESKSKALDLSQDHFDGNF